MLTLVSGGQTGVDRGAFETAIRLGLDFGGWAPSGFRAEDGRIPEVYARRMRESTDEGYALRTRLNVQDSDATLILSWSSSPEKAGGGTWFTEKTCRQQGKQCVHLRLPRAGEEHPLEVQDGVLKWLRLWRVGVLNVGGPRESKCPGIQAATIACLRWLLEPLAVDRVRQLTHELGLIEQAQPDPLADLARSAAELGSQPTHIAINPANVDAAIAAGLEVQYMAPGHPDVLYPLGRVTATRAEPGVPVVFARPPTDGPPEGLDAIQRAQLDASIREAERDIREAPPMPPWQIGDRVRARPDLGIDRMEMRVFEPDPVEERCRAYHDLVATAPGPIGVAENEDDADIRGTSHSCEGHPENCEDHEPPVPGDPTA